MGLTDLTGGGADSYENRFAGERVRHWDEVARTSDTRRGWGEHYRKMLSRRYKFLVPPGQRVLEIGCGRGDLLAALEPSVGVGIDFSGEMIGRARSGYPHLRFLQMDAHDLQLDEVFDVVILSDVVDDLWDVQGVLQQVSSVCIPRTRVILNSYSRLWGFPLAVARRLGLATRVLPQNWLTVQDLVRMLDLAGFEVLKHSEELLLPLPIPVLSPLLNRFPVRVPPFRWFALSNFLVARPHIQPEAGAREPSVSVVVAARNEAGNIPEIFRRVPAMGRETELVFVEGGSTDGTYEAIERSIAEHPERPSRLMRQAGAGKGDAVRLGFSEARGEILMILDADMTVAPEDLPRFYEAMVAGKGEFVNGVRLVYPMEKRAMRAANLVANKFFGWAFSWLLGQPVKDTLCGTKVLWKSDYVLLVANRQYFGDFDPFGDFDLLFGAAKLNLKIVDLPIRYRERTYGSTNISRWKHGVALLRMCVFAAARIKFV